MNDIEDPATFEVQRGLHLGLERREVETRIFEVKESTAQLEHDGIISPLIGIECQYKHPTIFNDDVEIDVRVEEFKGVRLVIGYTMTNADTGEIVLAGKPTHCFSIENSKQIILKNQSLEFDRTLKEPAIANNVS